MREVTLRQNVRKTIQRGTRVRGVVEAVSLDRVTVRLSANGARLTNLQVLGTPAAVGDIVNVDYSAQGIPYARLVQTAQEVITLEDTLETRRAKPEKDALTYIGTNGTSVYAVASRSTSFTIPVRINSSTGYSSFAHIGTYPYTFDSIDTNIGNSLSVDSYPNTGAEYLRFDPPFFGRYFFSFSVKFGGTSYQNIGQTGIVLVDHWWSHARLQPGCESFSQTATAIIDQSENYWDTFLWGAVSNAPLGIINNPKNNSGSADPITILSMKLKIYYLGPHSDDARAMEGWYY